MCSAAQGAADGILREYYCFRSCYRRASGGKNLVNKGEVLVKQNCSRCHAIGKEGDSPHPQAPPFRTLSRKYPIEDITKSLAEGIVSGHPDMPVFVFDPNDVEAIVQYLESIQIETR